MRALVWALLLIFWSIVLGPLLGIFAIALFWLRPNESVQD